MKTAMWSEFLSISFLTRWVLVTIVLLLSWPLSAYAQPAPIPPCRSVPQPAYADPGVAPNVLLIRGDALPAASLPSDCLGWAFPSDGLIVALAGSIRFKGGSGELLGRFGEVSRLVGIRYWSVTDGRWLPLITDAAAIQGDDRLQRRSDFASHEMQMGAELYFVQRDNRSTNEIRYRMRVLERAPTRLVVSVENVDRVMFYFLPLFSGGSLRATYFLDKLSPYLWGYYSLSALGRGVVPLVGATAASSLNRAAAIYRHIAGTPTDGEPPLAP
jgi:hypothetical protein